MTHLTQCVDAHALHQWPATFVKHCDFNRPFMTLYTCFCSKMQLDSGMLLSAHHSINPLITSLFPPDGSTPFISGHYAKDNVPGSLPSQNQDKSYPVCTNTSFCCFLSPTQVPWLTAGDRHQHRLRLQPAAQRHDSVHHQRQPARGAGLGGSWQGG